jgi:hypothetical protein
MTCRMYGVKRKGRIDSDVSTELRQGNGNMSDRWKRVKQNSNGTGLCRIEEHKKNGMTVL